MRNFLSGVIVSLACVSANADVVTDWNRVAISVVSNLGGTGVQSHALAMTHIAMFDAINAIDPRFRPLVNRIPVSSECRPVQHCVDASASATAFGVLTHLVPQRASQLERAFNDALSAVPDGDAKRLGITHGTAVAVSLLAARQNDGMQLTLAYSPSQLHGRWAPTPPDFSPAAVPHFGLVKPLAISSAQQFALAGPPAFNSDRYQSDLREVLRLGASRDSGRTAEQSESALFWNILTHLPFNDLARRLSNERQLNVHDNAKLFVLLHAVGTDSQIVTWHWKYHFDAWRPISAIRATLDAQWLSLIYSPPHPEYPSGHAAYGGAVVAVLNHVFGHSTTNLELFNAWSTMTRRYASFDLIAQDIVNARVWAGVHFRSSDEDANTMGRQIADTVLEQWLKPLP